MSLNLVIFSNCLERGTNLLLNSETELFLLLRHILWRNLRRLRQIAQEKLSIPFASMLLGNGSTFTNTKPYLVSIQTLSNEIWPPYINCVMPNRLPRLFLSQGARIPRYIFLDARYFQAGSRSNVRSFRPQITQLDYKYARGKIHRCVQNFEENPMILFLKLARTRERRQEAKKVCNCLHRDFRFVDFYNIHSPRPKIDNISLDSSFLIRRN